MKEGRWDGKFFIQLNSPFGNRTAILKTQNQVVLYGREPLFGSQ